MVCLSDCQSLVIFLQVVNCVPTPELRGEMLTRFLSFLFFISPIPSPICRLSLHLTPLTGILCLVLPTRCVVSSSSGASADDSLFLSLLRSLNLITPSGDRFPSLDPSCSAPAQLSSLLLRSTPKLSFYILMHSPSVVPSHPLSSPAHTDLIASWILQGETSELSEGSEYEEMRTQEDKPKKIEEKGVSEELLQNLSSLLVTLQSSLLKRGTNRTKEWTLANDSQSFLSESGSELIARWLQRTYHSKKTVKDEDLRRFGERGSISGFMIHLPDCLLHLLFSSLSQSISRPLP
jgi:hypothetical protein